jgi:hypothetical protein
MDAQSDGDRGIALEAMPREARDESAPRTDIGARWFLGGKLSKLRPAPVEDARLLALLRSAVPFVSAADRFRLR